jgi:outer membrane protein (fragment)
MRNFVFTFVLIFAESFFTPLLAADLIDNCLFVVEDTICSNPDREPNIEGCEDLYYRCLNQQIVMRGKGKKGFLHIIIEFIINNNGKVSDIKVVHSSRSNSYRWIKKIIKHSVRWKPGIKDGKPVKCKLYYNTYLHFY